MVKCLKSNLTRFWKPHKPNKDMNRTWHCTHGLFFFLLPQFGSFGVGPCPIDESVLRWYASDLLVLCDHVSIIQHLMALYP